MASQVSQRGQITIDRSIRQRVGIKPGMIAYQRVVDGRLEVVFLPGEHERSLYGAFHRRGEPATVTTGEQLAATVARIVSEKYSRLGEQDE